MKALLSICVFLISTASIATAQQRAATVSRAQTREAESRLTEMGYWSGAVDGVFDSASHAALIAFV